MVVAPHAPGLKKYEVIDGIEVHRFQYFMPARLQCLAYQHEGLYSTLKKHWLAVFQLPFFLLSMFFVLLLRSRGAQVIHAQWLPTLLVAVPVAVLRQARVFATARGADVNNVGEIKIRVLKVLLARVDAIFVVSEAIRNSLDARGFGGKVQTLFNGVDARNVGEEEKAAVRKKHGLSVSQFTIVYVGGLIRRKRVDTLLDAVDSMLEKSISVNVIVVGEGPLEQELRSQVASRGHTGSVLFAGQMDHAAVLDWITVADVLVLPSESEGRPNVVLEAFAMNTAVVASQIDGTNELVVSGKNGLLFPVGDSKELHDSLLQLMEDKQLRSRLALAGQKTLSDKNLNWNAHGEQLHQAYCAGIDS